MPRFVAYKTQSFLYVVHVFLVGEPIDVDGGLLDFDSVFGFLSVDGWKGVWLGNQH